MQMMARDGRPTDIYVLDGAPFSISSHLPCLLGTWLVFLDMRNWTANRVLSDRSWLVDDDQAVNIEAEALLDNMVMVQTRRIVRLAIVIELYQPLPEDNAVVFGEQLALGYTGDEALTIQRGEELI